MIFARFRPMEKDRIFKISLLKNCEDLKPEVLSGDWEALLSNFEEYRNVRITRDEYNQLSKAERSKKKDGRAFLGGTYFKNRRGDGSRKSKSVLSQEPDKEDCHVESRCVLTLDLDEHAQGFPEYLQEHFGDYAWFLHESLQSDKENPRYRTIFPLDKDVRPDEYWLIANYVQTLIPEYELDKHCFQATQFMYMPSRFEDYDPESIKHDGKFINADKFIDKALLKLPDFVKSGKKDIADPRKKRGVIGAFCQVYSIEDVLDKFIPGVYEAKGNRYRYCESSSSPGMVVFDDGLLCFSHHENDPACTGHFLNAFDLVLIHKFGYREDPDVAIEDSEEFKKALEFAEQDDKVKKILASDPEPYEVGSQIYDALNILRDYKVRRYQKKIYALKGDHFVYLDSEDYFPKFLADRFPSYTSLRRKKIKAEIYDRMPIEEHREFPIQLKNGFLIEGRFSDSCDVMFTPYFIDIPYNPDAKPVQAVDDYLNHLSSGEEDFREYLLEVIGMCLITSESKVQQLKSFFIIQGEGDTGKGTFLRVIRAILGQENCYSLKLEQFDEKFLLHSLLGKLTCLGDDLEDKSVDKAIESTIKNITSADTNTYNRKGIEAIEGAVTATLIFTSNFMIDGFTDAPWMEERLNWIPIRNKPKERRSDFVESLTTKEALEYWISLIVPAYQRLWDRGSMPPCEAIEKANNSYWKSQTGEDFFKTLSVNEITGHTTKEIREWFNDWCIANEYDHLIGLSAPKFRRSLFEHFPEVMEYKSGDRRPLITHEEYLEKCRNKKRRTKTLLT